MTRRAPTSTDRAWGLFSGGPTARTHWPIVQFMSVIERRLRVVFTPVGDTVDAEREPMIELRLVTSSLAAASVTNLQIGECVMLRDRWFYVRGVSPMAAADRVELEDADTGEVVEASSNEIAPSPRWQCERDPLA